MALSSSFTAGLGFGSASDPNTRAFHSSGVPA
jgi:hypothetical protein